jgi:hypothetical protein
MKTYLQMDGGRLVEYVEKREYDAVVLALHDMTNLLESERADFGVLVDKLERELQNVVKRMKEVSMVDLDASFHSGVTHEACLMAVRDHLIQAAKGEQP